MAAASWSKTLRLPKTSFPTRLDPKSSKYNSFLKQCTDDLYQKQSKRQGKTFLLHDGPPYANGPLHIGHAVNKILKDMICRVELQRGFQIRFVPGWDCHGLPIEMKALGDAGVRNTNPVSIRQAATRVADLAIRDQMKTFRQWAIMADWKGAWSTKTKSYEISQLKVFQDMVRKGLINRRLKPVYWSPSSQTALAEAELEYKEDHVSTAAYVKFPLSRLSERLEGVQNINARNLSAVIWTTTPWTLPANRAIAVNPTMEYVAVQIEESQLLIAKELLDTVVSACGIDPSTLKIIADDLKGSDLEGSTYKSLLRDDVETLPVILADFVSAESGSGLVHCAPGHGVEDYEVCKELGIAAFTPVDDSGLFTSDAYPKDPERLKNLPVLSNGVSPNGSTEVLSILGDQVLHTHQYKHKYPYDWRTKLPVIIRATEQWFADVGSIKYAALKSLDDVEFVPASGRSRLESFVRGRSEWCISRQRAWGVPIPALYSDTGVVVLTEESISHIISVINERGINAWWTDAPDDPAWVPVGLQGNYSRGKDTMDVWFDSGTSWTQEDRPADVCLEGSDQHRGWFQSSLLTHTSSSGRNVAPFRKLITHGFTLDQQGKKMSKSIGNVISPSEVVEGTLLPPFKTLPDGTKVHDNLGPDVLRLFVASNDYTRDISVGTQALNSASTLLKKLRSTFRWSLGSMTKIQDHQTQEYSTIDKIALVQLGKVLEEVAEAYRVYDFNKAVTLINRYVVMDLSAFYINTVKDRLYCGDGQSVLSVIVDGLMQMLAPVTPLLVTEAYHHKPPWHDVEESPIHPLERSQSHGWVRVDPQAYNDVEQNIPLIMSARSAIMGAQEQSRKEGNLGSSLESHVKIYVPKEFRAELSKYLHDLPEIFVVSSVELVEEKDASSSKYMAEFEVPNGIGKVWIEPPIDHKCPRCWRYVAKSKEELCKRCEDVVADVEVSKL